MAAVLTCEGEATVALLSLVLQAYILVPLDIRKIKVASMRRKKHGFPAYKVVILSHFSKNQSTDINF
jgi:hypothetical protein